MRITQTKPSRLTPPSRFASQTAVLAIAAAPAARSPEPVVDTTPVRKGRSVEEVLHFLGIPPAEATPKVREGIAKLLDEVERLRREGEILERRIAQLESLADCDPLIPVVNRRAFIRDMSRRISEAQRYGSTFSVLYLDVNGMKQINDGLGHGAGDAALKHVAAIVLASVRKSDTVGRLGGDEFGVLLGQADLPLASRKAEEIAATIARTPMEFEGRTVAVSASIGSFAFDGETGADDLLAAADRAMYRIKRARAGRSSPEVPVGPPM